MKNYILHPVVYNLCGGDVNSYILETTHYVFLIDTAVVSARKCIESALVSSGVRKKQLVILNTHGHWDHTALNRYLQEKYGALILAHKDMGNWCDQSTQFERIYGEFLKLHPERDDIHQLYAQEFKGAVPENISFVGGEQIKDDGFCLRVLLTPGHSTDSISFYEPEERLLFTGDAVQGNGFDGNAPFYCDANAYIESVTRLSDIQPVAIYCGHGIAEGRDAAKTLLQNSEKTFQEIDRAVRMYWKEEDEAKSACAIAEMFRYADGMHILTTSRAHWQRANKGQQKKNSNY